MPSGHRTIFALLVEDVPRDDDVDDFLERDDLEALEDALLLLSPMAGQEVLSCEKMEQDDYLCSFNGGNAFKRVESGPAKRATVGRSPGAF